MEDTIPKEEEDEKKKKKEAFDKEFMKTVRNVMGLNEKPTIPNYPINKKIQKKLLKEHPKKNQSNSAEKKEEIFSKEDQKEITKKMIYPSGIIKTIKKNSISKIIYEDIDYKDLKEIT